MYINKKLKNRTLLIATFLVSLLLVIPLVFSIVYYPADNIFNVKIAKITHDANLQYKAEIQIESIPKENIDFDIEILYLEENLVTGSDQFVCNDVCRNSIDIKKTFFGKYKLIVTGRYKGRFYQEEIKFKLDLEEAGSSYTFEIPKQIEIDPLSGVDIYADIETQFGDPTTYTFEIFPESAPDNVETFQQTCEGSCQVFYNINSKIVIDEYFVNIYSQSGDYQTTFEVVLPYERNITELPPIIKKKFNNYFAQNSTKELKEYYFYNNVSNKDIDVKFKKNRRTKQRSQIQEGETVDIEFTINNDTVKQIVIPDAKPENVSIGFEEIRVKDVDTRFENKTVSNAFAIDPRVNEEVETYTLTFVATGTELFKCKDYNFATQTCFGNFTKVMNTIPGVEYTLTLTPEDPIFVEIIEPTYRVQTGEAVGTATTFSETIQAVNQSQAFILTTARSASTSAPNSWQVTPFFTNDSQVSFSRYATTSNVDVQWQVIESNQFSVQRGNGTLAISNGSINIDINAVDLSQTFAIVHGRCADATTSDNHAGFFFANLTSTTNLNLQRGQSGKCAATYSWQVVEYSGSTVQSGSASFDSTATSVNDGITTVDRDDTFLIFGTANDGSDPGMDSNLIRGAISSDTQLTFTRAGNSGTSDRRIVWYTVEHTDMLVDSYNDAVSSADSNEVVSVTNTSRTFLVSSHMNSGGGQTYRNFHYTMNLTSTTNVFIDKETTSQTTTIDWFTIEFDNQPFDPTIQVNISATSQFNLSSDNLSCNYELGADVISVFTNWHRNGDSIYTCAFPMEGNSSNALLDYANATHNATNFGATWNVSDGFDGNGTFDFDGTNDYLNISDHAELDYTTDMTMMAWARMDGQSLDSDFSRIISKGQSTTTNGAYGIWVADPDSSSVGCRIISGGAASDATLTTGVENDNDWHHYVCTYDGVTLRLYVDGSNVANTTTSVTIDQTTDPLQIGTGNYERHFNGSIDDVRLLNRSLSKAQIIEIYENRSHILMSEETNGGEQFTCSAVPFSATQKGQIYPALNFLNIVGQVPVTNLSVLTPSNDSIGVYQNAQYNVELNASCIGAEDCDDISVTLVYEGPDVIGEAGSLTFENNENTTISFAKSYAQTPVIIAVPATDTDADNNALIPVVHSINTTHATLSLCEDAGVENCSTTVESEEMHYFVFDIDEANKYDWIHVGRVNSITTNGGANAFSYGKTFTNTPYIFLQSQTYNSGPDAIAPHAWATSPTVSGANIVGCDHPAGAGASEDVCAGTASENFGFVAIDMVLADIRNLYNGSESISDSTWTSVTFNQTYTSPRVMVSQNSEGGSQDPQYPWAQSVTGTGAQVRYCEQDGIGDCDGHNAETIVWMVMEDGLIETHNITQTTVSNTTGFVPIYTTQPNPRTVSINSGEDTTLTFPIFPTGSIGSTYKLFGQIQYGNDTTHFNITVLQSVMNITLLLPINNTQIVQNETFTVQANLSCIGDCGNISVFSRGNLTNINETIGTTPLWTNSSQPQACIPGIDGNCLFSWTVNATGDIGSYHSIDTLFTSTVLGDQASNSSLISIVEGPEVRFNQTAMNITGVFANYQSGSNDATIETILTNHTNVTINCDSGSCPIFSTNFTNGADLELGNSGVLFTCDATSEGTFSALFSITSNEDTSPFTMNVSCTATQLPLFVNLVNPDTSSQYDIERNQTFNITFNISCTNPGGCTNVDLGLYYEPDSIGEAGTVTLSNFATQAVTFTRTYEQIPVVIAVPATNTDNDNNSLIPVTTDITTTGFNIALCEDAGASTCSATVESEDVHYYVFDVDATNQYSWIDVGYINNINTNGTGVAMTFNGTFTNTPYVFAQAQTDNDGGTAIAPSGWFSTTGTTGATFIGCDHPAGAGASEDVCGGSTTENYSYVAIDPNLVNISGISMGSSSISNSEWTTVSFSETYTTPIISVYQNSEAGVQDPQNPWARLVTGSDAQIRYCEQDGANDCDGHSAETVVWMALEEGLIELGNTSDYLVDTTVGALPFYTTSSNPQSFNLSENTSLVTNFTVNATGTIEEIYQMLGILNNGVDTETLTVRIIGENRLQLGVTNLTIGPVFQDESPEVSQTWLYSRYTNNNVTLSCYSGDCFAFSSDLTNGTGLAEGQNTTISFICDDQTVGNFTALINVSSNELPHEDTINLSCSVVIKPLDIDLIIPPPLNTTNVVKDRFFEMRLNVTCHNASGCNNVDVNAAFEDVEHKAWWNRSWEFRQNVSLTTSHNSSGNYTFLLELNSSAVGSNFMWNKVCNDVRFIYNNTQELNYWVEDCSFASENARIWISSHEPLNTSVSYNFSMYYGNGTVNSTSSGNDTFIFFEDFEDYGATADGQTPPNWVAYLSGNVFLQTESNGNRAVVKTTNDDANGGFTDFGVNVTNYTLMFKTNRINELSGASNRYAISNSSASGYGPISTSFGATTSFQIERRDAGTATNLATGSTWSASQNTWYTIHFSYDNTNLNYTIYDSDYNRLNSLTTSDSAITQFSRFYIHGGQEYLTDDIALRVPLQTEPTYSIGVEESSYSVIPQTFAYTPLWTNTTNPERINLTDNQTIQILFYVNASGNFGENVDILGFLSNGDRTNYGTINITFPYEIHLNLSTMDSWTNPNNYTIDLSLRNLALNHTPINKTLLVYLFISNQVNISSDFIYSTSGRYNTTQLNTTLNDPDYNGTIYQWYLSPNASLPSVFKPFNGSFDTTNSWDLTFNITTNQNFVYEDMIMYGMDPQDLHKFKIVNYTPVEKQEKQGIKHYFGWLIQIFINLFNGK